MQVSRTIVVGDLTALRGLPALGRGGRVALRLPALAEDESARWQGRLNASRSNCGCATGQLFLLVALLTYSASLYFRAGSIPWSWFVEALLALGLLFGSAAVGKAVGIARARRRLRRDVEALAALLEGAGRGGPGPAAHLMF